MEYLPTLNAILNGISAILISLGYYYIKQGKSHTHKRFMISAISTSTLFLISYITFHYYKQLDSSLITRFEGNALFSGVYYTILISHTILAMVIVPLIILAVVKIIKHEIEAHKRIVKWAFPMWIYVSITGVLIYFMLYHM